MFTDHCLLQSSSEKHLPAPSGNKCSDTQLEKAQSERLGTLGPKCKVYKKKIPSQQGPGNPVEEEGERKMKDIGYEENMVFLSFMNS